MSKMLKALKKADDLHKHHFTVQLPHEVSIEEIHGNGHKKNFIEQFGVSNFIILVLIIFLGAATLTISYKIIAEFKKSQNTLLALSSRLSIQGMKLNEVQENLVSIKSNSDAQINEVKDALSLLSSTLKNKQQEINGLSAEFNLSKVKLRELAENNQILLEKQIVLNAELEQLKKEQMVIDPITEDGKIQ